MGNQPKVDAGWTSITVCRWLEFDQGCLKRCLSLQSEKQHYAYSHAMLTTRLNPKHRLSQTQCTILIAFILLNIIISFTYLFYVKSYREHLCCCSQQQQGLLMGLRIFRCPYALHNKLHVQLITA